MNYKEILKQSIDEFVSRCLTSSRDESFIKFLERKNFDKETMLNVIKELLNNKFIKEDKECLSGIAFFAVRNNEPEILQMLIDNYSIDPSYGDNFFIKYAVQSGFTEIVKVLIVDSRVNLNRWYNYYIKIATESGFTEILQFLLKYQKEQLTPKQKNDILSKYSNYNEIVDLLNSRR